MLKLISSIAFKIAALYVLIGGLWIVVSDTLVSHLIIDTASTANIQIIKGWGFVAISALLLYKLIRNATELQDSSKRELQRSNEELATAYEELLATEEDLRQKLDELINREAKINRRNECLKALHETALTLMQKLTLDDLLQIVVKRMMSMSGAQYGYIYLLDEQNNVMLPKVIEGFSLDDINTCVSPGQGIIGRVWSTGQTLVIYNYQEWEGRLPQPIYERLRTGVGLPLKAAGQIIGVFSMNYTNDHHIDEEEMQMLKSLADLASIAISNTSLNHALQNSQIRKQALIDALPDSIFHFDCTGTVLDYKLGTDCDISSGDVNIKNTNIDSLVQPDISQKYITSISHALTSRTTQTFEYEITKEGSIQYQEVRIVASGAQEAIAIIRNITERKEMEKRFKYMSMHDRVTGLYNRFHFEDELKRLDIINHIPVGVMVCDIDGLKLLNDTLGHQAGDELLINAAQIIKSCISDEDVLCRIGGDEFAIILPDKRMDELQLISHSIQSKVNQFRETHMQIPVSISTGISVRSCLTKNMVDVFKAADNNMYREKLHSSYSVRSAIVQTLATALEARDFVTDGHADRLQDLAANLALAAGLPEHMIPDLRLLGRFHDIGKVGIPDHILFKPCRLTEDEFEIMKRHCEIGYRIAQSSADLSPIADWVLKHQEWWNGKGYPLGLSGDNIPLACRILSIVDAYDAMTNNRPYRQAMCHEDALAELDRNAGTQFDPHLVRIFKEIIKPSRLSVVD